ncbi:MAG: acetyl ornithine aminotransferase family protein [Chloroflexota bacterium]
MKRMTLPGPKGRAIIERDRKVNSSCYTRPYPFVMDHGKGVDVWDVDNNHFLDFASGIATASTGHSHPAVVKAIQEQAEIFLHISSDFYHIKWVELAEKLISIRPFKEEGMVFLGNSGTESVEAALKLARYHSGRDKFIAFLSAFHGRTLGSLSAMGSKAHYRRRFSPFISGVFHVPYPNCRQPLLVSSPGEGYGTTIVRYIEEQIIGHLAPADEIAGILVEPIQGEGGYVVPPLDFFPALRELCDRYDILLIADEVQTGVGRTGKWWGIQHFGVEPDIVCFAKGIASGIPLGGIIARKSVMDWDVGAHGNTFGGNPIACVAALATLNLVETELMQNAFVVGSYALDKLKQMMELHPHIMLDVRGFGLMIGIEIADGQKDDKGRTRRDRIVDLAFEYGLLILGCGKNVIRLIPPLTVTKVQIDEGLSIFESVIDEVE